MFTPRRDHQGKVFLLLKPVEKCVKCSKNGDVGIRFLLHIAISQSHVTNNYRTNFGFKIAILTFSFVLNPLFFTQFSCLTPVLCHLSYISFPAVAHVSEVLA